MIASKLSFQNRSIRVVPDLDVIGTAIRPFDKGFYYTLKTYLDWNSVYFRRYKSKKEWQ